MVERFLAIIDGLILAIAAQSGIFSGPLLRLIEQRMVSLRDGLLAYLEEARARAAEAPPPLPTQPPPETGEPSAAGDPERGLGRNAGTTARRQRSEPGQALITPDIEPHDIEQPIQPAAASPRIWSQAVSRTFRAITFVPPRAATHGPPSAPPNFSGAGAPRFCTP